MFPIGNTHKEFISKMYIKSLCNSTSKIHTTQEKKWAKDHNGYFSKKDLQISTGTWKDAQHHELLEKCKLNVQWGKHSYLLEWPSENILKNKY